jgi:ribosomal protein S18 acetylase RimI-like enzyme
MIIIKAVNEADRTQISRLLTENWGSCLIVSRGIVHDASALPGFIAEADGKLAGLITYNIENSECEIVSLDSFLENKGIGISLIDAVVGIARLKNCSRVWLITTNDNTHAIRFYQKRGFRLSNIYLNAIAKSREIKPQIPLLGLDDIPIEHEIEFEKRLDRVLNC